MNSSCRLRQALRANFTARVGCTPSGRGASRVLLGHKSSPRRRLSIPAAVRLRLFPSNSPSAARAPSTVARSAQLLEMIVSTVSSAASGLDSARKHCAYASAASKSSPSASSEIALQHNFETLRGCWHITEELGEHTSATMAFEKKIDKTVTFFSDMAPCILPCQISGSNDQRQQLAVVWCFQRLTAQTFQTFFVISTVTSADGALAKVRRRGKSLCLRSISCISAAKSQRRWISVSALSRATSSRFRRTARAPSPGSRDGLVKVWDAETGASLCTLHGRTGNAFASSADGLQVVIGSEDEPGAEIIRRAALPSAHSRVRNGAPSPPRLRLPHQGARHGDRAADRRSVCCTVPGQKIGLSEHLPANVLGMFSATQKL
jgi:hypothetical protein